MATTPPADEHQLAPFNALDKLLEHRLRLAICVLLAREEQLAFTRLKQLTGETDGNLGANLRKLEDAGYLRVRKTHMARRPVTWYRLQPRGRRALAAHLDALTAVIHSLQADA